MVIIVITASFYANDTLSFNVESVHFDQAINAVLSLEKIAKNIMFKPLSIGTVKTSFMTTDPYISQMGTLAILIDGNEKSSFTVNCFKVKGSERVGVSFSQYYLGDISYLSRFILVGLNGSISCVKKYQDNGAWVSLDYGRIRCVYSGEMNYYNGTNPEPVKRNVIEITAIKINSGGIDQFIDNSRIILENTGIQIQQIEYAPGNFVISGQFSDKNDPGYSLIQLGGNATLPTLINFTIINFEISIFGGG
jgi:hypothetical protein